MTNSSQLLGSQFLLEVKFLRVKIIICVIKATTIRETFQ